MSHICINDSTLECVIVGLLFPSAWPWKDLLYCTLSLPGCASAWGIFIPVLFRQRWGYVGPVFNGYLKKCKSLYLWGHTHKTGLNWSDSSIAPDHTHFCLGAWHKREVFNRYANSWKFSGWNDSVKTFTLTPKEYYTTKFRGLQFSQMSWMCTTPGKVWCTNEERPEWLHHWTQTRLNLVASFRMRLVGLVNKV